MAQADTAHKGISAVADFYYTCNNAFQKRGCGHTAIYRAGDLEDEVMRTVDGVLSDPERVRREVDAAIAREEATLRDPGGAAEALSQRLTAITQRRAAYQEQQAAGLMTLAELTEKLKALDEDRATLEAELRKARDAAGRIEELKERRTTNDPLLVRHGPLPSASRICRPSSAGQPTTSSGSG